MATFYRSKTRRKIYITEWLKYRGMSQAALARAIDTNPENISRWIMQPWRLNLDAMSDIAAALDLQSPAELFDHPDRVIARRLFLESAAKSAREYLSEGS